MKPTKLLLLILLIPCTLRAFDPWTTQHKVFMLGAASSIAMDYITTWNVVHSGGREVTSRWILTGHPSPERLWVVGVGSVLLTYTIANYLPTKYNFMGTPIDLRSIFLCGIMGTEIGFARHNAMIVRWNRKF